MVPDNGKSVQTDMIDARETLPLPSGAAWASVKSAVETFSCGATVMVYLSYWRDDNVLGVDKPGEGVHCINDANIGAYCAVKLCVLCRHKAMSTE